MKKERTWILIADAGHAHVLERVAFESKPTRIDRFDMENPIPKTSEMVRDRLPRTFESVGDTRHAMSPREDPRRAEKAAFAERLIGRLGKEFADRAFERLVIVAPPQMLGDLRASMPDDLREVVLSEVPLNLTHTPDDEVLEHLKDYRF